MQTSRIEILSRSLALWVSVIVLLLFTSVSMAYAAKSSQNVQGLRIWHSPDRTRIVFDVSDNVQHKVFTLEAPKRLVVDIQNGQISTSLPLLAKENSHLIAIRSGRPTKDVLRFVFELKKDLNVSDFVLSPNELYSHRLVVDLHEISSASKGQEVEEPGPGHLLSNPASSLSNAPSVSSNPTAVEANESTRELNARPFLIAIDAGHGGEDPGALGYRGSREKSLTLSIAKALQAKIAQDPKLDSFLVRSGDYYIKLHKRREMARDRQADMFISIHADAFRKRSARGFSVFALSQSGATSAMARALAAKENASDQIGGVSLADKDEVLAKVLVDLSMTNTISESVNFGGRVLKELTKIGRPHSKRVEQAGFAVLKSADIPSVLIETGFITNPTEEKNLRSAAYQKKLAAAIYTAIAEYYQQTPYRSNANYANVSTAGLQSAQSSTKGAYTSLVKPTRPKKHKVVRGDSLSTIALRYDTSISELKRINGLKSNTVHLGRTLVLPAGANQKKPTRSNNRPEVYVVRSGDSLSRISAKFNVKISSIKSLNGLRRDTVYRGQKLKIPNGGSPARANNKPIVHKVRRGDTLSEIAERYGVSQRSIMKVNGLRSALVKLGQQLKIP